MGNAILQGFWALSAIVPFALAFLMKDDKRLLAYALVLSAISLFGSLYAKHDLGPAILLLTYLFGAFSGVAIRALWLLAHKIWNMTPNANLWMFVCRIIATVALLPATFWIGLQLV
jgi:hypothetical protein